MEISNGSLILPSELDGHGTLKRGESSWEVTFRLFREKYAYDLPWRLTALGSSRSVALDNVLDGDIRETILLSGAVTTPARRIHIPAIHPARASTYELEGDVLEFDLDTNSGDLSDPLWHATVHLTPTQLAIYERDWEAEDTKRAAKSPPLRWSDDFAIYQLYKAFSRENLRYAAGEKASIEIPRAELDVRFEDAARSDPFELLTELEARLLIYGRVLGLLGRRRITPTRIEIRSLHSVSEHREIERHKIGADTRTQSLIRWPLISARSLSSALDAGVMARFAAHPMRPALENAIDLLLTSREETVIFGVHRFVSTFTAFEAAVNAYARHHNFFEPLSRNPKDKLVSLVRRCIREFTRKKGVEGVADALMQKAPEVARPGFTWKAERTICETETEWEDLWPEGTTLKKGLGELNQRRNLVVHGEPGPDLEIRVGDTARLSALTERLIYRLLEGSPEWVSRQQWRSEHEWLRSGRYAQATQE